MKAAVSALAALAWVAAAAGVGTVPQAVAAFREVIFSHDIDSFRTAAQELREWQMATDPHYPVFHFTAPESWNNDPNGLVHDPTTGLYHRFYQFRPLDSTGASLTTLSACLLLPAC